MVHTVHFLYFFNFKQRPFSPTELIKSNQPLRPPTDVTLLFLFSDVIEALDELEYVLGCFGYYRRFVLCRSR
jgi:hypothetical protein